ncbi:MAG: hypothetical protein QOH18_2874, partial [Solirubrobacterales bacterium]|nr:hypothetical protein [Solirubrobacterales bacterium]
SQKVAEGVRGLLIATIISEGLSLAYRWLTYEKNVESEEDRALREMFTKDVVPGVEHAFALHGAEAVEMTNASPEFTVYAVTTVDLVETWDSTGIGNNETGKSIKEARFVDLSFSFQKVEKEQVIDEDEFTVPLSSYTKHYVTKRKTYSVVVDFGETPAQRQWRTFLHQASQAVSKGYTARSVAGGTHFGGDIHFTAPQEREERRRTKWREPVLLQDLTDAERRQWVRAYIEYTSLNGPDALLIDAIEYLKELEQPAKPAQSPYLWGRENLGPGGLFGERPDPF